MEHKLKTYIINLEKSTLRKQYMQDLLSGFGFLDIGFIKAVDGRVLSDEERSKLFDYNKSMSMYGRGLNAGEVGCALSHRLSYRKILENGDEYALVLEDDIVLVRDLNSLDLNLIDSTMKVDKPRVMMLSGDYWYYRKGCITRLFSAVGAYAYIINRAGARKMLSVDPACCLADDWQYFKRKGLKLYAVYPYMIDANTKMDILGSDVNQDSWGLNRSKMSLKEILIGYYVALAKRCLKRIGHFEYKIRVIDSIVVENRK